MIVDARSVDRIIGRMSTLTTALRLADAPTLRWMSLLSWDAAGLHYGGKVWPTTDAIVRETLRLQIDERLHKPSLLVGHASDAGGDAIGAVERYRIVSRDEARALGIQQRTEWEAYAGVEITSDEWAAAYDAGRARFTSPELRGDLVGCPYVDDGGKAWQLFIGELSFVRSPHLKRQVPANELIGVSLADRARRMTEEGMEPLEEIKAALLALAEELRAIKEQLGAAAPAAEAADAAVATAPETSAPGAPEQLAQEVAALREQLAYRDAQEAVRSDSARVALGDAKDLDRLARIRMQSPAAYAEIVRVAPARVLASPRVALSEAGARTGAIPTAAEIKAHALARGAKVVDVRAYESARRELMGGA